MDISNKNVKIQYCENVKFMKENKITLPFSSELMSINKFNEYCKHYIEFPMKTIDKESLKIFKYNIIFSTRVEITNYRKSSSTGTVGGLLDFLQNPLPTIIVPDLHARTYFLKNIFDYKLPNGFLPDDFEGTTVLDGIKAGKLRIICIGDAMHSELRGRQRWLDALSEFKNNIVNGPQMTSEMLENLWILAMILDAKITFPEHFHFLKGNHENIMNDRGGGDYPFCKFANEGEMVYSFVKKVYGDDILMLTSCFEKALPLVAVLDNCVISHAEPVVHFTVDDVINGLNNEEVVTGLTWTPNDAAQEGSVVSMLKEFTKKDDLSNIKYFAGHRPVTGNYYLRQNGYFVQIHNPEKQNIVLVYTNKDINLEEDIKTISE
jgi:hypothetical protein